MTENLQYLKIWRVVQKVPEGKVASYGQIADLAGLPGRARLVGKALGNVPESGDQNQNVPWHRVLRSSGQLAFPIDSELFNKQRALLIQEGVVLRGRSVNLKQYQWQPDLMEILFELSD
jgi:methylated-DNA-protein-cysteine methyltransferase-like protein